MMTAANFGQPTICIKFGHADVGISYLKEDNTRPREYLNFAQLRKPAEKIGPLPDGHGLKTKPNSPIVSFIFENAESVDTVILALNIMKDRFAKKTIPTEEPEDEHPIGI